MPLVYQQNINAGTKIGVWHIAEGEDFFLKEVSLQRTITHWHKRLQHLAGRLLLKRLFPEFPVGSILIADTKKPFIENEAWHFSISHSGDYAAAMVSTAYRVGVDVEYCNQKIMDIRHKFVENLELQTINEQLSEANGQRSSSESDYSALTLNCVTLAWCVKEAVFKWWGSGGVDFRKDILIESVSGNAGQGIAHCVFKNETKLDVHFLHFNDCYIAWVLTLG